MGGLLDKSTKVALFLDDLGVGAGDKVSVYATTRHEWAYCTGAIEVCRAIFVPVYFSNTPDQTRYVINHSDSVVLFTEMALLPNILLKWHEYPPMDNADYLPRHEQITFLLETAPPPDKTDTKEMFDVMKEYINA